MEPAGTRYRTFHSQVANTEVSYLVYLPPEYDNAPTKRYPVIYWLHGLGGDQRTGASYVGMLDAAIKANQTPAMIVILVNGMRSSFYCDSADGKLPVESVIIKDLIPQIDVVVENSTPGVMARRGLGYEDLRAINPRIILFMNSTFGSTGPYKDLKALIDAAKGKPDAIPFASAGVGSATHWVFAALLTSVFPTMMALLAPGVVFLPGFKSDMTGTKAMALEAWALGRHGIRPMPATTTRAPPNWS